MENLRETVASLFLHFHRSYEEAAHMRRSEVREIFESSTFRDWKKAREAEQKIDVAVINRLDVVIKALGQVGKAIVSR
ncbi:MAG: hypothetical protein HYZ45_04940 [Burkholderiales bacterium]|nr:hypothetical protein [Burkholderiales bacterium]